MKKYSRKKFIRQSALAAIGVTILPHLAGSANRFAAKPGDIKIGIIGLDTSHSVAFTDILNNPNRRKEFDGFSVAVACPYGSRDIKTSYERIPSYTEKVQAKGVEVVASIEELLQKCDVVMLETNDGKPKLEQAMKVLKAGKKVFIDKPVAAQLSDVVKIYEAADRLKVPVFSSSALRYTPTMEKIISGAGVGRVTGADMFSPGTLQAGHIDMSWYGIHGVEPLFAVMGLSCKALKRTFTPNTDFIVGEWEEGRIGTVRATRDGDGGYGGIVFGEKGSLATGGYTGYEGLLLKILQFFTTGIAPVSPQETLAIYAFMEAADESKRRGGKTVALADIDKKFRLNRR